ncbi:MAG: Kinase similar to eukaryotic-like N-acetylglucosamine kinase [Candidatus Carbobacillus altaicus]|uniref:Kinase similar to eukaryotic-like N-acetylglucosamine kinase n=1 Tax=Candidatus Carbonibacillus altaicus TaxID=2163959 RepID=A0A2R6Y1V1_9BACL|nr:MAG: Kinase similar to eukaryotic-like N-acetylglucosamine kinase [Candidatus Carbobacillus altaicus]
MNPERIPVYVGVDGGGTKTRAVVASGKGKVLLDLTDEGANVNRFGWKQATTVLSRIFEHIRGSLGDAVEFRGVFLGLSGMGREADRSRMATWLECAWPGVPTRVDHDALVALAAARGGEATGIVLIAGTGSIAFAYDEAGRAYRAGGWGYLLGDEGSGFALGRRALVRVVQSYDGRGAPTVLTDRVLEHFELDGIEALVRFVYRTPDILQRIPEVAPLVLTLAREGDAVAQAIVAEAVQALIDLVDAVQKQAFFSLERVSVVLAGGLMYLDSPLRMQVQAALADRYEVYPDVVPPVVGAVLLARRLAGDEDGNEAGSAFLDTLRHDIAVESPGYK